MKNLVLMGYRGSGKSSIGRALAALLGRGFVDTDVVLVERAGKTIKEIFEQEGEAGFRDRESAVIADVAAGEGQVIAIGGGAILRGENVAALKRTGRIVWLKAPPEVLYARIQGDAATNANRPNLTAGGGLEEVKSVLARRSPGYEKAADLSVEVHGLGVAEAALKIREWIEGSERSPYSVG